MAKNNKAQSEEKQAQSEEQQADGAYEGASSTAFVDNEGASLEDGLNEFSPTEETERQQAEYFPRSDQVRYFDGHEKLEKPRVGQAATHRSEFGRVVAVDYDCEYDGEVYKAGVQDLPLDVANALIEQGLAFEPAGKKKGR